MPLTVKNSHPNRALTWLPAVSLLAGLAFLTRAVLMLTGPVTYWSPSAPADYLAAFAYSTGMLGLALTLWLLRSAQKNLPTDSSGRGRAALGSALAVAAGAAATNALANAFEDGLGVKWLGSMFVVSSFVFLPAMVVSSVLAFWNRTSPGQGLGMTVSGLTLGWVVGSLTFLPLAAALFVVAFISWAAGREVARW